jgi:hypothetical protein
MLTVTGRRNRLPHQGMLGEGFLSQLVAHALVRAALTLVSTPRAVSEARP